MSFFERQHAARASSLRLVLMFIAAVLGIVVVVDAVALIVFRQQPASTLTSLMIAVSVVTLLIILSGSVWKTMTLRAGGSALAESVGAVAIDPTTSDPSLRRLVNVVEEMSLASGVPAPRLYVLPKEPGINAFAAGYTPADATITVTGGALHDLNRAELQGVIGHEFSHILNGDMRMNVRLIGLLNGILLLGLVGLRVIGAGGGRGRGKGAGPILLIALAMMVLGFVGQFFAKMIKAAVSRQREWLADASSVQFTRDPQGLEGALKKIAGLSTGSTMLNTRNASEVSHMLFSEGRKFSSLFATHPPLAERIAALDPSFRPEQLEAEARRWKDTLPNGMAEDIELGFAAAPGPPPSSAHAQVSVNPAQVSAQIGTLSGDHLAHGARLSAQVPQHFRQLANQPSSAVPLVLALLVHGQPQIRDKQLGIIASGLGADSAKATAALLDDVAGLPELVRLPVISIAIPLITARPRDQLATLTTTLTELAHADGTISVFEYCLTRMIAGYLADANDPPGRSRPGKAAVQRVQQSAFTLLAAVAAAGNQDPAAAKTAFDHAVQYLLPQATVQYQPPQDMWSALDAVWPPLDSLGPRYKQRFVEAMVVAVSDDGVLGVAEAELLRTACGLLHCSLPTLVS